MIDTSLPSTLILASTSPYRKTLLQRLGLAFHCEAPGTDESAGVDETPARLVNRLAVEKAAAVARDNPEAVVVGSDQVAVHAGDIIGKPGDHEHARAQLASFSGQQVQFLTAVSVQRARDGFSRRHTDRTRVYFRTLERAEIERYLLREQPYDCAGAFRAESLGISLFARVVSEDPTALVGLPLIKTGHMLRQAGFQLP